MFYFPVLHIQCFRGECHAIFDSAAPPCGVTQTDPKIWNVILWSPKPMQEKPSEQKEMIWYRNGHSIYFIWVNTEFI